MQFTSIDKNRLKSAIASLTLDCIHLKQVLRTRWTRPMIDEQRRLIRVRRAITELHVLLALSRKRLHVIHPPRDFTGDREKWNAAEYNQTIATRLLPEYETAPAAAATTNETTGITETRASS
jgi:hypothetical protein